MSNAPVADTAKPTSNDHNLPEAAQVIVIEHRHGTDAIVCLSPQSAQDRLHSWVIDNWDHERERGNLTGDLPLTADEAISEYFEAMTGEESYLILTADVFGR